MVQLGENIDVKSKIEQLKSEKKNLQQKGALQRGNTALKHCTQKQYEVLEDLHPLALMVCRAIHENARSRLYLHDTRPSESQDYG